VPIIQAVVSGRLTYLLGSVDIQWVMHRWWK
jgi:hypothetical protein